MPEPTPLMPALTGSFSSPAGGNPTGAMMEAAYAHHGLLARYVNADVAPDGLADAVRGAVAMGWLGFNLSLPHRQAILPMLDSLAPSAQLIGAVNCVVAGPDGLEGHNTDGQGFVEALREHRDPAGRRVVVLGGGGAARAICVELALAGAASVTVVNRTLARAKEIAEIVRKGTSASATAEPWEGDYVVDPSVEIVVNATSIGLDAGGRVPVDADSLREGMLVCDVIPSPPDTQLLQTARERGAETLDGRSMLANQAAINFRLWTGVDPDRAVMHAALDEAIGGWVHP